MTLGLSLPLDIPWKRLAASEDMMVRFAGDPSLPRRWRSSMAIFGHEPAIEDQLYEGSIVSYIKIVSTLTGFQADGDEVGLKDRRAYQAWLDPAVIENYEETVSKYYGCYGAVLEVIVTPAGSAEELRKMSLSDYPFFVDFEPKKRELYEIVSDTGEVMSRSLESVNVRKGATTSDSHEVLDIFGGASGGVEVTTPEGGGGVQGAVQGQWGTRDINQQEAANVRTTDSGRESRETFSHTTQLTQMYHQLNSYHLGTNRAVFYMLPRPHIMQSPNTFVNGPRVMEGIQEIFLVVMRPKTMKNICIEAYLETAHIAQEPIFSFETGTAPLSLHMALAAPEQGSSFLNFGDDNVTITAKDSETFVPPEGWEIDLDREGGVRIDVVSGEGIVETPITKAKDHVTINGEIEARFVDHTFPTPNESIDGRLDLECTVFIRKKTPTVTGYDQTMWMTGRNVSTCPRPGAAQAGDYVSYERRLKGATQKRIGADEKMSIQEANQLRSEIGRQVFTSLNSPDRYPTASVKFVDTRFVASSLGRLIRKAGHPDNQPLASIKGLDPAVKAKVAQIAANVSRGRLMEMSLTEISDRFGLTVEEAIKLRRATLGLAGPAPAPKDKWQRPIVKGKPVKPQETPTKPQETPKPSGPAGPAGTAKRTTQRKNKK